MEDELDAILAQYGNFDLLIEPDDPVFSSFDPVPGSSTSVQAHEPLLDHSYSAATQQTASTSPSSRFALLKTDTEVEQTKASAVPANMRKNTS